MMIRREWRYNGYSIRQCRQIEHIDLNRKHFRQIAVDMYTSWTNIVHELIGCCWWDLSDRVVFNRRERKLRTESGLCPTSDIVGLISQVICRCL